jgi:nicotinate phosphoribosyltransferase
MSKEFNNLLIDFYELTMGQGFFNKKIHNNIAYFDLFFRKNPDNASFVIANGVKKCAEFLSQFHFSDSDIEKTPVAITGVAWELRRTRRR